MKYLLILKGLKCHMLLDFVLMYRKYQTIHVSRDKNKIIQSRTMRGIEVNKNSEN